MYVYFSHFMVLDTTVMGHQRNWKTLLSFCDCISFISYNKPCDVISNLLRFTHSWRKLFKGWQYLYRKKLVSWHICKNFIGSFDTTKYGSIPMIYVGLFPLLLAITFFFVKSIKFYVKLSYFILLAILILSFRFQLLDLLWQGMHAPNMFLHRYSWIFSLTIILMAGEVLIE